MPSSGLVEEKSHLIPEDSPLFPNHGKDAREKAPRAVAVVDQSGCTGCEVCIDFCPVDSIEIAPNPDAPGLLNLIEIDPDRCIGCTLCTKHCPWETIEMIQVKNGQAADQAAEWTIRSVMFDWGKEKYPGQEEYFTALKEENA